MFLNARFELLIHTDKNDKRVAFSDEVVAAMNTVDYFIDNPKAVISPRT